MLQKCVDRIDRSKCATIARFLASSPIFAQLQVKDQLRPNGRDGG